MSGDFKRLYRLPIEGRISGLCAGIGEYFRIDPVFVRLAWLAVTFMTGVLPGVLVYLAGWFLVPAEPMPRVAEPVRQAGENPV